MSRSMPGGRCVEDRDRRRSIDRSRQTPSRQQPHPHDTEIVGGDLIDSNALICSPGAPPTAIRTPRSRPASGSETGSGRCHSGQRPRLVDEVSPHGTELRVVSAMLNRSRRFTRTAGASPQHSSSARVPDRSRRQSSGVVERLKKEDGPGQQHGGQHHLHDQQRSPGAERRPQPSRGAGGVAFRCVRSRGVDRRGQAEEQGGEDGDHGCEPDDATVERGSRTMPPPGSRRRPTRNDTPHRANNSPASAPSETSTAPSVKSWRIRRPRPAPIASRTAIRYGERSPAR